MLEPLLMTRKRKLSSGNLLDLDFTSAVLGAKTLTNIGTKQIEFQLLGDPAQVNSNFGVVNHPTIGKCFQFNGINMFSNLSNQLENFSKESYDLEAAFIRTNNTSGIIFSSGCYVNSPAERGTSIILGQFAGDEVQIFLHDGTAYSYVRNQFTPNGFTQGVFNEIRIEKRPSGMVVKNLTLGTQKSFAPYEISGDTLVNIGGYYSNSSFNFAGYLKYLRLKKVA